MNERYGLTMSLVQRKEKAREKEKKNKYKSSQ